jgi:hypothetical protein
MEGRGRRWQTTVEEVAQAGGKVGICWPMCSDVVWREKRLELQSRELHVLLLACPLACPLACTLAAALAAALTAVVSKHTGHQRRRHLGVRGLGGGGLHHLLRPPHHGQPAAHPSQPPKPSAQPYEVERRRRLACCQPRPVGERDTPSRPCATERRARGVYGRRIRVQHRIVHRAPPARHHSAQRASSTMAAARLPQRVERLGALNLVDYRLECRANACAVAKATQHVHRLPLRRVHPERAACPAQRPLSPAHRGVPSGRRVARADQLTPRAEIGTYPTQPARPRDVPTCLHRLEPAPERVPATMALGERRERHGRAQRGRPGAEGGEACAQGGLRASCDCGA